MDLSLVKAVEGFLIGAIPTIILFLILWFAYRVLVHVPLRRVLQERYDRTEGALAKSKADIAAATARTAEYEQRMREARQAIFKGQEARRQQLSNAHETALADVRKMAHAMVGDARAALEQEMAQSKIRLQQDADKLSEEVIRSVLKPVAAAPVGGRG